MTRSFCHGNPKALAETGVSPVLVESLICKYLLQVGTASGREIARRICLPFALVDDILSELRKRQLVVHVGQAQLNDYVYRATETGNDRARAAMNACGYIGPVPVPLSEYILSVEAQTIRAEAIRREHLERAFHGISVEDEMFATLGPAINSGAGLFLYGHTRQRQDNTRQANHALLQPARMAAPHDYRGRPVH